jgi:hypothetical protein
LEGQITLAKAEAEDARFARDEAIKRVRQATPPATRAAKVASIVGTTTAAVLPEDRHGQPGFWVSEPVFVELQVALTSSISSIRERAALLAQIDGLQQALIESKTAFQAEHERALLFHNAFDEEHRRAEARPLPPFWQSPIFLVPAAMAAAAITYAALK